MKKLPSIAFLKLACLNYNSKRYHNTKQTLRTCLGFVYFYFLMFCFKTKQLKVQKIIICNDFKNQLFNFREWEMIFIKKTNICLKLH